MDNLDEQIKNSQKQYQPTINFADVTTQQITKPHKRRFHGIKLWAPALAGVIVAVAVVFVVIPNNSNVTNRSVNHRTYNGPSSPSTLKSPSQSSQAAANGSAAEGTDNASLTSDLNSINSAINQENNDQTSANSAINDQSQEITVPTD